MTYRIMIQHENRKPILYGYFSTDLDTIKKAMTNNIKGHPLVIIYEKGRKSPIEIIKG